MYYFSQALDVASVTVELASAACARNNKRLDHITTASQWETFIHIQGGGLSRVYRSGSMICVQPTSFSR